MRIAFYAPLKHPDHPVPSGDRTMARLLIKSLELAGHEVEIVSRLRSFGREPAFCDLEKNALLEAERIVDAWRGVPADLWFSYHPYYKAPDLIGLNITERLGIPVVTAEASLSRKRESGEWARHQEAVLRLVGKARANLCFTQRDYLGLSEYIGEETLIDLPPFIDTTRSFPERKPHQGPVRLVSVAMMRGGVKLESYEFLARALSRLNHLEWTLKIVGDGNERKAVEKMFEAIAPERIDWTGEVEPEAVPEILAASDIFVWPGVGEAYGLSYLEAQACGVPVVALDTHGVPFAVDGGHTAILTPPDDLALYGDAIGRLIEDTALRTEMSANAIRFAREERSLEHAAEILDRAVRQAS